jgi:hypothetical protein
MRELARSAALNLARVREQLGEEVQNILDDIAWSERQAPEAQPKPVTGRKGADRGN